MGLYNFQKRFAPYVEEGSKRHTIRARRKHEDKPGATMHLFTGLRQKGARLLGRFPCVRVESILITADHRVFVEGVELSADEKDLLAWRDGFRWDKSQDGDVLTAKHYGCFERLMMLFWSGRLPFEGNIFYWKWSARKCL